MFSNQNWNGKIPMKKTVIAVALVALAPLSAQADLLFTVGAKASIWNAEPTGQIDTDVSVEEDGLNLEKENGQQITVFFLNIRYRLFLMLKSSRPVWKSVVAAMLPLTLMIRYLPVLQTVPLT
jgi:hypothetical protein